MPSISTYFDYAQYKSLDGTGAEVAKSKKVEVMQEVLGNNSYEAMR
ncbi:hypothetical protein [Nostoc sp. DedQUE09]|nr:hypothetical protein [Nostoc sp. DedQUE09]MDZ7954623.1 hypothetical protein [Nostoc sp. DedQUE09]